MKPDWSTLTEVPYTKGHACVMVNMYEENGDPLPLCPCLFLQRMVNEAAKEGIYVKAVFENEFIVVQPIKEDGAVKPIDDTPYGSVLSMDINSAIIKDMANALVKQGIKLEQYHPEVANGQQELIICYCDVLMAADQQVIVKEAVKAIALQHNCLATFIPTVFPDQAGNGTHIHFSLHTKDGTNITPSETKQDEISETTGHFISGMLECIEGIMALSTPTTNSMRRITPSHFSCAFHIWSYSNREATIRVPYNARRPNPTHFKFRTLALAVILI